MLDDLQDEMTDLEGQLMAKGKASPAETIETPDSELHAPARPITEEQAAQAAIDAAKSPAARLSSIKELVKSASKEERQALASAARTYTGVNGLPFEQYARLHAAPRPGAESFDAEAYAAEIAKIDLSARDRTMIDLPFIHFDGTSPLHLQKALCHGAPFADGLDQFGAP